MTARQKPDRWRKSSSSAGPEGCVELSPHGTVRDSKNPSGPVLPVNLPALLAAVKHGRIG
jgi:hypothetical protein